MTLREESNKKYYFQDDGRKEGRRAGRYKSKGPARKAALGENVKKISEDRLKRRRKNRVEERKGE